jgi:uncharacterized membrane protein YuzA (DUF378 family)
MKGVHAIAFILLIIGGLNWLLVGVVGWDISHYFGGMASTLARVIYVLVGLSAIVEVLTHKKSCKACDPAGTQAM